MAEEASYSTAITEGSKAVGKVVDLVKNAGQPIADAYGLIIGDHVAAWRERNLDAMSRRTREILQQRNVPQVAPVAEQIAIPILEAAQRDPREEMQEIWARLLANAMDPARRNSVRPEFIEALNQFHPTDAAVLQVMGAHGRTNYLNPDVFEAPLNLRFATIVVSMVNLINLDCAETSHGSYKPTYFGLELLKACEL